MMALIHGFDGFRAGIKPLGEETVHHQIGEAVVKISDKPIEVPSESGRPKAESKSVQEGPGAAQPAPSSRDDFPRISGHLEPPEGQRTTYRRPQHRLAAEIEKPLAGIVLPQLRVRRVAFPEDRLEQPRHCDQKRSLVGLREPDSTDPALAGPLSYGPERHVTDAAVVRERRRRLFQDLHS